MGGGGGARGNELEPFSTFYAQYSSNHTAELENYETKMVFCIDLNMRDTSYGNDDFFLVEFLNILLNEKGNRCSFQIFFQYPSGG